MSSATRDVNGLNVSRMAWAWESKKLRAWGYQVDGGIWPWLRFVRPYRLEDYIYSPSNKLRGLAGWLEDQE